MDEISLPVVEKWGSPSWPFSNHLFIDKLSTLHLPEGLFWRLPVPSTNWMQCHGNHKHITEKSPEPMRLTSNIEGNPMALQDTRMGCPSGVPKSEFGA